MFSEVLANMKYEYSDHAAFFSLLPNQWKTSTTVDPMLKAAT